MIFTEKITNFVKISNNQAQLLAGAVVKVGARFFKLSSALTFDRTVTGLGGLDSGVIANSTFYYVYVVQSGGVPYLVASTNEQAPDGYTVHRKVGAFYTGTTGLIFKVYILGEINNTSFSAFITQASNTINSQTPDFIASTVLATAGVTTISYTSGLFSFKPAITTTSRKPNDNANIETMASICTSNTDDASGVTIVCAQSQTKVNSLFDITVSKQNVDAVQPNWNLY